MVNKPRAETLGTTLGKKQTQLGKSLRWSYQKRCRRGRKDHLETRNDIRLSVNYSNKHAGEWHLMLDVSQRERRRMPLIQTGRYDIQTLVKTNMAHIALEVVCDATGLLGHKVGQRLIFGCGDVGRTAVITRSQA